MFGLVALLLVVELAGLGTATATGEEIDDSTMSVQLSVVVGPDAGPVIAHLLLPGEKELVRPLVDQGEGRWTTELELRRANWRVALEAVGAGELSRPVTVTELGVNPGVAGRGVRQDAPTEDVAAARPWWPVLVAWGAGGLAVVLAAGVALASITARRGRIRRSHPSEPS